MQTRISQRLANARAVAGVLLGGLLLTFVWRRNYNLLGDFFDYSILASACGQMHEGLKPYRDFSTPLQSLTIYLSYGAELLFGRRYLALAYGNLVMGLLFYLVSLRLLKGRLPFFLCILAAAALGIATFFQHGILWYNSLAMMLLTLLVWCGALLYRSPTLRRRDAAALCVLLFLSSMCKINFHLLGLGLVCAILLLRCFRIDAGARKQSAWLFPVVILSAVAPGPLVEIMVNGTTPQVFLHDVFSASSGRLQSVSGFLNPNLYLGKFADFYPDNWSYDVYLIAILTYGGCAYLAAVRPDSGKSELTVATASPALRFLAPVLLAGFLVASMLLTLTNFETQILTASFVVTGLVAVFLMFAPDMSHVQRTGCISAILFLSGYFLVFGGLSACMHSRIRYGESSWTGDFMQSKDKLKLLARLSDPVPFYDASSISPRLGSGYFQGVRFTELARSRLEKAVAFIAKNNLEGRPQTVYWGPGLQILNRVYGDLPLGRFPLWYHYGLTMKDEDSSRIIAELKRDDYEWILATVWIRDMPAAVRRYIADHYDQVGDEDFLIYHQKP